MQGLRFVEIMGDSLEPVLYRRDFVLAAAVTGWAGEGLYVTRDVYGENVVYDCSVTCSSTAPRIRLGTHLEVAGRKIYSDQFVTRAEFELIVIGKVAMTCRVKDHDLIQRHAIAA